MILLFTRDNSLNINEFSALLKALFRNEKGRPYPMDAVLCTDIFNIFNKSGVSLLYFIINLRILSKFTHFFASQDGSMSREEFTFCWNNWIKKVFSLDFCLWVHPCYSQESSATFKLFY